MGWWKSFRHKLETAQGLSLGDWLVLAETWWVLLGVRLALRWMPFERLVATIQPIAEENGGQGDALAWAWHRQKLVSLAARYHIPPMTCLPRAVTLQWMASRRKLPSRLCIGVSKTNVGRYAHAWVEMQGENIGEPGDIAERFVRLDPAGGR